MIVVLNIKKGKNAILDTISANIEENFMQEMNSLEKVSKYISNWNNYYNLMNFSTSMMKIVAPPTCTSTG
mgnify:CR=1 FL=1